MGRKQRIESPTGYYHVMQRGAGKQILFEDNNDYIRYLSKLRQCEGHLDFNLVAYCLMNNHVHLLVHAENIDTLSTLIRQVGTSYASYYNIKYDHVGYVFQGRFLSEAIYDELHLLACVRYIHNNPVKAGFGTRDGYRWSSFNEYFGEKKYIDTDLVERILGSKKQFLFFSETPDDRFFLDEENDVVTCSIGQEIVRKHFGNEFENSLMVKHLCVEERNRIIMEMKNAGLSNRQIELVTGVSRGVVCRLN